MSDTRSIEQLFADIIEAYKADIGNEAIKNVLRDTIDQCVVAIVEFRSRYDSGPRTVPDKDLLRATVGERVVEIGKFRSMYESGPSTVPATEMVFTLELALQMAVLASVALGERN